MHYASPTNEPPLTTSDPGLFPIPSFGRAFKAHRRIPDVTYIPCTLSAVIRLPPSVELIRRASRVQLCLILSPPQRFKISQTLEHRYHRSKFNYALRLPLIFVSTRERAKCWSRRNRKGANSAIALVCTPTNACPPPSPPFLSSD